MTVCFLIEPTGTVVPVATVREGDGCPAGGDHVATITYPAEPERTRELDDGFRVLDNGPEWDTIDWPTTCDACPHEFTDDAFRSLQRRRRWRRPDTGETFDHPQHAGPGAMWDAHWMPSASKRPDGRYLVVITPDGREWSIDGPARNCTRPGEDHDCWCRHGDPPNVTVDKQPEPGRSTCAAGAGSIGTPGYHGFLRSGRFTPSL